VPDLVVLALALLLPVAYLPGLGSSFWAPKFALLLVAIPPGLLLLGRAAVRRDGAALAAVGFLVACAVSSGLADDPVASVVGLHDADGGLLFVAGCVGAWALARELSPRGRRWLVPALLVGIGITSAVAWLQMTVGLSADGLAPWHGDRAAALQGNPVFLGALASAALCLAVTWPGLRTRWWARAALVVLYAGALQLSGSRVGLAAVLAALGWAAWKLGWRHALVLVLAVGLGIGAASALARTDQSATGRSADTSADLTTRLEIWDVGLHAFAAEPVFGAGPARFRTAVSPHWTLALARAHGPDVLLLDGHNLAVEYLVTTGIVGSLLGAAWLALAARRARGPLVWFAGALLLSWLVQPQGVDTTPLLLIALGVAATAPARAGARLDLSPRWRTLLAVALIPGLLAGGWLVVGERQLYLGEHGSQAALDRAAAMIGVYPLVRATQTERDIVVGLAGRKSAMPRAIADARAVTAQEPTRPDWWNRLGEVEGQWGSLTRAQRAFERALALNPWSVRALQGLMTVASIRGDEGAVARYRARLCRLSAATCPAP
jgi:O-antigen ligase